MSAERGPDPIAEAHENEQWRQKLLAAGFSDEEIAAGVDWFDLRLADVTNNYTPGVVSEADLRRAQLFDERYWREISSQLSDSDLDAIVDFVELKLNKDKA